MYVLAESGLMGGHECVRANVLAPARCHTFATAQVSGTWLRSTSARQGHVRDSLKFLTVSACSP